MTNEPAVTSSNDLVMKRRLMIYEKIKSTKLNKLTIKQGDVNVKFNLKKDLLDLNVDIPEKVLSMLENYESNANKQNNLYEENETSSSSAPTQIPLSMTETPTSIPYNETQLSMSKTTSSPSTKRVRFDLNESHPAPDSLLSEDLAETSANSKTKSSIIITKITNKEQLQADRALVSEETLKNDQTNEINQQQFICRLCRLKCSNERALYEHVARLHGGKGPSNNQSYHDQEFGASEEDYEENDDFLEEDDDFDDQDSYLSSNSDLAASSSRGLFKKRKPSILNRKSSLKNHAIAKPNLAIRVAKAAYYNNKDSLNPLKSNIFTNGGIRGNFFSQERLPLKSCKIKMKLAQNFSNEETLFGDSHSKNPDKFLTNTTEITKFNFINKNTTITTQSIKSNEKELLLTEIEIKNFFKSLLNYIPNTITRLEDLIKQKEVYLKELDPSSFKCMRMMHEVILDAKQFGINLSTIKTNMQQKMNHDISLKLLLKILDVLLESNLILSVGVVERVYVAHEFKQHWVIQSYKNQKGVASSSNDVDPDSDTNTDFDSPEDVSLNRIEKKSSSGRRIITRRKSQNFDDTQNESDLLTKKFKTVCLIPRPWRYIDGLLNRPVLKQMLETIILHLKAYPNSTLESLYSHFSPILQPIMTLELIEMLEKLKCIQKFVLKRENSCDLFSDFNNGSFIIDSDRSGNENLLDGNEIFTYFCSQNSIFTIKKVFPD